MAADIAQVMRILKHRQIDIWLEGDQLVAKYRHGPLPEDMYSFIRYFRDQLVEQLAAEVDSADAMITRIYGKESA